MTQSNKIKLTVLIAGLFQMGNLGISPSLSKIATEFSSAGDAATQILMTFPDVMVITATLMAGWLAARLQRKWVATIGLACYSLAGVCGALFSFSFPMLFIWAAMLGLGMGLFIPTLSTIIAVSFQGEERSRLLGVQSAAVNVGGILLTVAGGFLSAIAWRSNYLVYVPAFIAMLCAATLLPGNELVKSEKKEKGKGRSIPGYVWVYSAMGFTFMIIYNIVPANTAMLFAERGYANAEVLSGFANGLAMAGGMLSALVFAKYSQKLMEHLFTIAYALVGVGLLLCLIHTVPTVFAGSLLSGAGVSFTMPAGMLLIGKKVEDDLMSSSASWFIATFYLGGFTSSLTITPVASLFSPTVQGRMVFGMILAFSFAAVSVPAIARIKKIPSLRD